MRATKRPGNMTICELLTDKGFTGAVLNFLRNTGVGRLKEGVLPARPL